jgi:hypothetical protein
MVAWLQQYYNHFVECFSQSREPNTAQSYVILWQEITLDVNLSVFSVTIKGNIQTKLSSSMHFKHSPLHSSNESNYLDFFFDHLNWEVQTSISYSEKFEMLRNNMYVQTYKMKYKCAQCLPEKKNLTNTKSWKSIKHIKSPVCQKNVQPFSAETSDKIEKIYCIIVICRACRSVKVL